MTVPAIDLLTTPRRCIRVELLSALLLTQHSSLCACWSLVHWALSGLALSGIHGTPAGSAIPLARMAPRARGISFCQRFALFGSLENQRGVCRIHPPVFNPSLDKRGQREHGRDVILGK